MVSSLSLEQSMTELWAQMALNKAQRRLFMAERERLEAQIKVAEAELALASLKVMIANRDVRIMSQFQPREENRIFDRFWNLDRTRNELNLINFIFVSDFEKYLAKQHLRDLISELSGK